MTDTPGADGVTLSVTEWPGDPERAVVAVHATGFCKEVWRPVAELLAAAGVRVVAFDQRGHGSSSAPPNTADWWGLGRDAAAVAASLGPFAVGLGHSSGATAVTMVDLLTPGVLGALVLIEPVVFPAGSGYDPGLVEGARRRRATFGSVAEARRHFEGRGIFTGWDPAALDGYLAGGLRPDGDEWRLSCDPAQEARFYEMGIRHGVWERLGEVKAATTLIAGEESRYQPPSLAAEMARRYRAELTMVPDAGHFVPMQRPDVVAEAVVAALARA